MMTDSPHDALLAFVDGVVAQLAKHGYPERRVAFALERMYESASAKGLSFNKVLESLAERGIAHEKTLEKVIFCALASTPPTPAAFEGLDPAMFAGIDPAMFAGIDPAMFAGIDPAMFAGIDPAMFAGLSQDQLLAAAQTAMQQMGPDQLAAVRARVEGMTPEQQAEMFEHARKLGLS